MVVKNVAKGFSVFWRSSKQRWVVKFSGSDGADVTRFLDRNLGPRARGLAEKEGAQVYANLMTLGVVRARKPGGPSLRERFGEWMKIVDANGSAIAPATVKGYRDLFKNVVFAIFDDGEGDRERCLADEPLVKLVSNFALLRRWIRASRARMSASRCRNAFYALKVMFADAQVERWFVGPNPLDNDALINDLPLLPTAAERGGVVILEPESVNALLDCPKVPLIRRVRYVLAATCGGRDGEVSGATWECLDLDALPPIARIEKAYRLHRRENETRGSLKTRTSPRSVPLHPAAVAALRQWRDDLEYGFTFVAGRHARPSDPVFPSTRTTRDGVAFSRPRMANYIRGDLKTAKQPTSDARGRPYDMQALRRSFGTWLERTGADFLTRKRLLGHGSNDVTDEHYTGENLRKMAEAVERLPIVWTGRVEEQ